MKKIGKFIGAFTALVMAIAVTAQLPFMIKTNAEPITQNESSDTTAVWSDSELNTEYKTGTTLTIPARTLTIGGQTIEADATIVYPDGRATVASKVTLDIHGTYRVDYIVVFAGKAYKDTVEFSVYDPIVSVQKAGSSISYGKYEYAKAAEGLMVSLVSGDTLRFHTAIDVSELTKDDTLVKAFATPSVKGKADFEKLTFTFRDASNPDIYLKVFSRHYYNHLGIPVSFQSAGANGQPMKGIEYRTNGIQIHTDDFYGTSTNHSFSLDFSELTYNWSRPYADEMPIDIRLDAENLQVYVCNNSTNNMIIDLDDIAYFDTLWSGFPSGKVYLEITPEEFIKSTANFCVTDVYGVDLTAEKNVDKEGPAITVDTAYEEMPNAERGREYKIPNASAWDTYDGICKVKRSVYYNYNSPSAILVGVKNDKFTVNYTGTYAIVYEASDYSGNTSKTILWVNALTDVAAPTISVEKDFEAVTVGSMVYPISSTVAGSCGELVVTVEAVIDGESMDMTNGFRPEKAGQYTIRYTVSDYIGQQTTIEKVLMVNDSDVPVFVDTPILPGWYVAGATYEVPALQANDYRGGSLEKKDCTVTITDGNGTSTYEQGATFIPNVANNGEKITLVFTCEGASVEYKVPVVIPTGINPANNRPILLIENYFDCNGVALEKGTDGIVMNATAENAVTTFINPLVAEDFSVVFAGVADKTAFKSVKVYLTDSKNPQEQICAQIVNKGSFVQILVADKAIKYDVSFAKGDRFTVGYSLGQFIIGTTKFAVAKTTDDQIFNGFSSGKILFSIEIEGATVNASAIKLLSVDNHVVNNMTLDTTMPKVAVIGEYGGCYSVGTLLQLPKAMAGDVINPNVTFLMSVTDEMGQPLKDVNGVLLENVDPTQNYTIKCSDYGTYSVLMTASEVFAGIKTNTCNFSYNIIVVDEIAPTIILQSEFVNNAKMGDIIIFPKVTVTDNATALEALVVSFYCVTPGGQQIRLPNGANAVQVTDAGIYEFKIVAMDEYGNMTVVYRTVTVE